MIKETITYTDYNGVERTEDFYFNLNRAEAIALDASYPGGYSTLMENIVKAKDGGKIIEIFQDLLLRSYGEKSADGKRFIKSEELRKSFEQTEAYVELFMKLATNDEEAIRFVNGIMPPAQEKEPQDHKEKQETK